MKEKEYLSEICPTRWDQEYPKFVMGVNAGQLTLDGDMLIVMNPESKFYTPAELAEPLPDIHYAPTRNLPLQFYLHPVRPRGRR